MNKADKIIIVISLVALLTSFISASINYFHNKELRKIEYGLSAVKNRPLIKLSIPHITENVFDSLNERTREKYLIFDINYENIGLNIFFKICLFSLYLGLVVSLRIIDKEILLPIKNNVLQYAKQLLPKGT